MAQKGKPILQLHGKHGLFSRWGLSGTSQFFVNFGQFPFSSLIIPGHELFFPPFLYRYTQKQNTRTVKPWGWEKMDPKSRWVANKLSGLEEATPKVSCSVPRGKPSRTFFSSARWTGNKSDAVGTPFISAQRLRQRRQIGCKPWRRWGDMSDKCVRGSPKKSRHWRPRPSLGKFLAH